MEWLGYDNRIKMLVIRGEGISGGIRFIDLGRELSLCVPIIAIKTPQSEYWFGYMVHMRTRFSHACMSMAGADGVNVGGGSETLGQDGSISSMEKS